MNEWMNEWMNGRTDGWIDGYALYLKIYEQDKNDHDNDIRVLC